MNNSKKSRSLSFAELPETSMKEENNMPQNPQKEKLKSLNDKLDLQVDSTKNKKINKKNNVKREGVAKSRKGI